MNRIVHPEVAALEVREQRLSVIVVDLIVVAFLPIFGYVFWMANTRTAAVISIAAWVIDLTSLVIVLRSRRVRPSQALTVIAMTLLVIILFVEPVLFGYGYIVLLTVPVALVFVAGRLFSTIVSSVYALAYALAAFKLLPVPWTIPDSIVVQFTIASTYAMIGILIIMVQHARAESYRTLVWTATHDSDTRLPMAAAFTSDMAQTKGTVILVALRDTNQISMRFGVDVLHEVRTVVAKRVGTLFGAIGVAYQFSQGSVLVSFPELDRKATERALTEAIPELTAPVTTAELTVVPALSFAGVEVRESDAAPEIQHRLVITMPVSHDLQPNRLVWFSPGIKERHDTRIDIGDRLAEAIDRGLLSVAYQPIVYEDPGRALDVEILVRWFDDTLGQVPPVTFVPIAEERGLIPDLTEAVIANSWRDLSTALEQAKVGTLWVNVSPVHLRSERFIGEFTSMFERHGARRECYSVELTEGALVDQRVASAGTLEQLRAAGFRLSIDDFGTGYSNLDYLRRFEVDRLKIDRSFVSGATTGSKELTIVQAILKLAQSLELGTVAEGVETAEQCALLRGLGVDACQGYFSGKPMDATELRTYIDGGHSRVG